MKEDKKGLLTWLVIVIAAAVLVRAGLWLAYPMAQANDTPTYQHLASSLLNKGGFDRYNGTRTPGYPFFLMLAGSEANIYFFQLCLGLLTTLLVFYIGWQVSRRAWFAGLLALAHTLNLGQIFFEATLLSEALATFLLFLCLACLVWLFCDNPGSSMGKVRVKKTALILIWIISLALGLAAAALAMVRPLFAFVPFWGAFFLLFFWRGTPFKVRLGTAALAALPALITLLLWVNFIHTQFNILGLDSIGGYHLVNHTTSFFELAPAEFAPIRDTFLKFRAKHIA